MSKLNSESQLISEFYDTEFYSLCSVLHNWYYCCFVIKKWNLFKWVVFECEYQCEKINFKNKFSKQQAINEDTATKFIKFMSIVRVCINLNR